MLLTAIGQDKNGGKASSARLEQISPFRLHNAATPGRPPTCRRRRRRRWPPTHWGSGKLCFPKWVAMAASQCGDFAASQSQGCNFYRELACAREWKVKMVDFLLLLLLLLIVEFWKSDKLTQSRAWRGWCEWRFCVWRKCMHLGILLRKFMILIEILQNVLWKKKCVSVVDCWVSIEFGQHQGK